MRPKGFQPPCLNPLCVATLPTAACVLHAVEVINEDVDTGCIPGLQAQRQQQLVVRMSAVDEKEQRTWTTLACVPGSTSHQPVNISTESRLLNLQPAQPKGTSAGPQLPVAPPGWTSSSSDTCFHTGLAVRAAWSTRNPGMLLLLVNINEAGAAGSAAQNADVHSLVKCVHLASATDQPTASLVVESVRIICHPMQKLVAVVVQASTHEGLPASSGSGEGQPCTRKSSQRIHQHQVTVIQAAVRDGRQLDIIHTVHWESAASSSSQGHADQVPGAAAACWLAGTECLAVAESSRGLSLFLSDEQVHTLALPDVSQGPAKTTKEKCGRAPAFKPEDLISLASCLLDPNASLAPEAGRSGTGPLSSRGNSKSRLIASSSIHGAGLLAVAIGATATLLRYQADELQRPSSAAARACTEAQADGHQAVGAGIDSLPSAVQHAICREKIRKATLATEGQPCPWPIVVTSLQHFGASQGTNTLHQGSDNSATAPKPEPASSAVISALQASGSSGLAASGRQDAWAVGPGVHAALQQGAAAVLCGRQRDALRRFRGANVFGFLPCLLVLLHRLKMARAVHLLQSFATFTRLAGSPGQWAALTAEQLQKACRAVICGALAAPLELAGMDAECGLPSLGCTAELQDGIRRVLRSVGHVHSGESPGGGAAGSGGGGLPAGKLAVQDFWGACKAQLALGCQYLAELSQALHRQMPHPAQHTQKQQQRRQRGQSATGAESNVGSASTGSVAPRHVRIALPVVWHLLPGTESQQVSCCSQEEGASPHQSYLYTLRPLHVTLDASPLLRAALTPPVPPAYSYASLPHSQVPDGNDRHAFRSARLAHAIAALSSPGFASGLLLLTSAHWCKDEPRCASFQPTGSEAAQVQQGASACSVPRSDQMAGACLSSVTSAGVVQAAAVWQRLGDWRKAAALLLAAHQVQSSAGSKGAADASGRKAQALVMGTEGLGSSGCVSAGLGVLRQQLQACRSLEVHDACKLIVEVVSIPRSICGPNSPAYLTLLSEVCDSLLSLLHKRLAASPPVPPPGIGAPLLDCSCSAVCHQLLAHLGESMARAYLQLRHAQKNAKHLAVPLTLSDAASAMWSDPTAVACLKLLLRWKGVYDADVPQQCMRKDLANSPAGLWGGAEALWLCRLTLQSMQLLEQAEVDKVLEHARMTLCAAGLLTSDQAGSTEKERNQGPGACQSVPCSEQPGQPLSKGLGGSGLKLGPDPNSNLREGVSSSCIRPETLQRDAQERAMLVSLEELALMIDMHQLAAALLACLQPHITGPALSQLEEKLRQGEGQPLESASEKPGIRGTGLGGVGHSAVALTVDCLQRLIHHDWLLTCRVQCAKLLADHDACQCQPSEPEPRPACSRGSVAGHQAQTQYDGTESPRRGARLPAMVKWCASLLQADGCHERVELQGLAAAVLRSCLAGAPGPAGLERQPTDGCGSVGDRASGSQSVGRASCQSCSGAATGGDAMGALEHALQRQSLMNGQIAELLQRAKRLSVHLQQNACCTQAQWERQQSGGREVPCLESAANPQAVAMLSTCSSSTKGATGSAVDRRGSSLPEQSPLAFRRVSQQHILSALGLLSLSAAKFADCQGGSEPPGMSGLVATRDLQPSDTAAAPTKPQQVDSWLLCMIRSEQRRHWGAAVAAADAQIQACALDLSQSFVGVVGCSPTAALRGAGASDGSPLCAMPHSGITTEQKTSSKASGAQACVRAGEHAADAAAALQAAFTRLAAVVGSPVQSSKCSANQDRAVAAAATGDWGKLKEAGATLVGNLSGLRQLTVVPASSLKALIRPAGRMAGSLEEFLHYDGAVAEPQAFPQAGKAGSAGGLQSKGAGGDVGQFVSVQAYEVMEDPADLLLGAHGLMDMQQPRLHSQQESCSRHVTGRTDHLAGTAGTAIPASNLIAVYLHPPSMPVHAQRRRQGKLLLSSSSPLPAASPQAGNPLYIDMHQTL